jgi:hypothetical protein
MDKANASLPSGALLSPEVLVIPTNGKACPELAEGDLHFSSCAAQGFSSATKSARIAVLAVEVRFVSGHGFSRAASFAKRAPLGAGAGS